MPKQQPVHKIPVNRNSDTTTPEKGNTANSIDRLYRSETDRIIAGVAGGLGEYFNLDPTLFRLGFVLITLAGGSGILLYLIMWLILPTESQIKQPGNKIIEENAKEVQRKTEKVGEKFAKSVRSEDAKLWWSVILIIVGFAFLFQNFGLLDLIRLSRLWPLILIILGVFILIKNDRG